MSAEQRREPNWRETESTEDAARRLLAVLDERSRRNKASGRLQAPEQIQKSEAASPCVALEKRPADERNQGSASLQSAGQLTVAWVEGEDGNGLGADGVDHGPVEPGDVLKHPSATSADLFQDAFTNNGSGVRREAGDVRWGVRK